MLLRSQPPKQCRKTLGSAEDTPVASLWVRTGAILRLFSNFSLQCEEYCLGGRAPNARIKEPALKFDDPPKFLK